jgi:hypothetical protein
MRSNRWVVSDDDSLTAADVFGADVEEAITSFLGTNPVRAGGRVLVVQRADMRKRRYEIGFTRDEHGKIGDLVIAAVDRDWCLDAPVTAANV